MSQETMGLRAELPMDGHVGCLRFSTDGHTLATSDGNKYLTLWADKDLAGAWTKLVELETTGKVGCLAYHPTEQRIATGDNGGMVIMWDLAAQQWGHAKLGQMTAGDWVWGVSYSPDGHLLLTGEGNQFSHVGTIRLWDTSSGEQIRALKVETGSVRTLTYSLDGSFFVCGDNGKCITLWGVTAGTVGLTMQTGGATRVKFSPSGTVIASGSFNKKVTLWDRATGMSIRDMVCEAFVLAIDFSPDGRHILSGDRAANVIVWDVETGKAAWQGKTAGDCWAAGYSTNGKSVASGDGSGQVVIWDAFIPGLPGSDPVPTDGVERRLVVMQAEADCRSVVYSPDSSKLATGDKGSQVIIWDVSNGKKLTTLRAERGFIRSVAWSPNGKMIAAGDETPLLSIWDASSGLKLKELHAVNWVMSVVFSPDSAFIGGGDKANTVSIWDVRSGSKLREIEVTGWVLSLAVAPDHSAYCAGDRNGQITLISQPSVSLVPMLASPTLISVDHMGTTFAPWHVLSSISPSGQTLVAAAAEQVRARVHPRVLVRPARPCGHTPSCTLTRCCAIG